MYLSPILSLSVRASGGATEMTPCCLSKAFAVPINSTALHLPHPLVCPLPPPECSVVSVSRMTELHRRAVVAGDTDTASFLLDILTSKAIGNVQPPHNTTQTSRCNQMQPNADAASLFVCAWFLCCTNLLSFTRVSMCACVCVRVLCRERGGGGGVPVPFQSQGRPAQHRGTSLRQPVLHQQQQATTPPPSSSMRMTLLTVAAVHVLCVA